MDANGYLSEIHIKQRATLERCASCGGDGCWHQEVAPTPETVAIKVYPFSNCPTCGGSGWVNPSSQRRG